MRVAVLGSVGVPARYGGFETLAENLVAFHARQARPEALSVYCSRPAYPDRPERHGNAELRYSKLRANGASSIAYDATTLRDATRRGADVALMLGVSGAVLLPFIANRGTKLIVHVDGLEWRRGKWSGAARRFLRWSERIAVSQADAIVTDSAAVADHVQTAYGRAAETIAYGGDQAVIPPDLPSPLPRDLPKDYALALCRIEPENNALMILEALAGTDHPLVFVGNWSASRYGRDLRGRFQAEPNIHLLDPIYAPGPLHAIRHGAARYIHGHSAGGTNPALVEMMHVGRPIMAFDCVFNRQTTHDRAVFFDSADALRTAILSPAAPEQAAALTQIARTHYMWDQIGAAYFELFERVAQTEKPKT